MNAEYLAGGSIVGISAWSGVPKSSLHRHFKHHVAARSGDSSVAIKQLIEQTQQALFRAQRKGDAKIEMDCLKLLATLRTQSRIATVTASSASSPSASPEPLEANHKLTAEQFDQKLREVYHLTGPNWSQRIKERDEHDRDVELFERLKELVERTEYERSRLAAAATYLGSLLIGERPDEETMDEIKKLLLEGDEHGTSKVVETTVEPEDANAREGIDAESDAPSGHRDDSRRGDGFL